MSGSVVKPTAALDVDKSVIYRHDEFVDDSVRFKYAAEAAQDAAKNPHLPVEVRGGLGTLGALATGVGIHADVQDGESGAQAVTSQGGGLVAGAIVVGGAELAGGTIAAIGGDRLIDSLWPDSDGDQAEHEPSVTEQRGGTLSEHAGEVTKPVNEE